VLGERVHCSSEIRGLLAVGDVAGALQLDQVRAWNLLRACFASRTPLSDKWASGLLSTLTTLRDKISPHAGNGARSAAIH
jgi:hypothetical protein